MAHIESIHVAEAEGAPARAVEKARVVAGVGVEGDRYSAGRGHFSGAPGTGRALTLVEAEVLESAGIAPGEARRNLVTRGVRLNPLVGRRFRIGGALCEGMRLCEPCAYLEGIVKKPVLRPLAGRGGLRADVLVGGEIRAGDALFVLPQVRPIAAEDRLAVAALNNLHSVEIGLADEARMRQLIDVSVVATAIGERGDPDAFLLAFDERTPPQGPNHAWFLARGEPFLYVDRVAVHPRARRRGLAHALYDDVFARAAGRPVCCEVNSEPPNPVSDAFHAALGFREVGRAFLPDRGKSVRYLERR